MLCEPTRFSGLCVIWVAVVFHRIHVLHSKHAVFYGFWCRQWGKAKIQALSAEVIRLLVDNLWNILLLRLSAQELPPSPMWTPTFKPQFVHTKCSCMGKKRKKRSIPKGYLVGCIPIFFTGWHKTHLNSKHNLSGISAHTHDTHMPHMNLIIHLTVVSTPKPRNYTPSCITSCPVYISLPWKEQTPLNPHPTLARSSRFPRAGIGKWPGRGHRGHLTDCRKRMVCSSADWPAGKSVIVVLNTFTEVSANL